MGILKKIKSSILHKRKYYIIKMYSFYKKDFWGLLRWKRFYKYKKALYNSLRTRKKFYYLILYQIYSGIQFYNKKYNYKSNLILYKKCLKFFYGYFHDSYIGKLGRFITRKKGIKINKFFSFPECRIDVVLYRNLYTLTIRQAYLMILYKIFFINMKNINIPTVFIKIGDIITILQKPNNFFPFLYSTGKILNIKKQSIIIYLISLNLINFFFNLLYLQIKFLKVYKQDNLFKYNFKLKKYIPYINNNFNIEIFLNFSEKLINFFLYSFFIYKIKIWKNYFFYIFKFFELLKYCLIKQQRIFLFYLKYKFLYGYKNLKIRFKFLFFLFSPNFIKKNKNLNNYLIKFKSLKNKLFRIRNFSYLSFKYFLNLSCFSMCFSSYLNHFEVNYKIHMLILFKIPTIYSLKYPFSLYIGTLYKYFKTKSYF